MLVAALLALAALAAPAAAHFKLVSPPPRIYDDLLELDAPCGGVNTTMARTPFPIKGGKVAFAAYHPSAAMVFNIAFTQQPIAQADFAAKWYPDTTIGPVGNYNYDVDLSNLPQAKDGVNATLQLMYNGGDGMLYQCTDIVLSSSLSTGGTKNAAVAAMLPAGAAAAAAALSALALIL